MEEETPRVSLLERLFNLVAAPTVGSGGESDSPSTSINWAGLEGGAAGGVGYKGLRPFLLKGPSLGAEVSLKRFKFVLI